MPRPHPLRLRSAAPAAALALALSVGMPGPWGAAALAAQGESSAPDAAEVRDRARDAQAAFERLRRRSIPLARGSWGGSCDEVVGRMCMRVHGGSDWWPSEDSPELRDARSVLLARLDELQELAPGDGWILGQRVTYRVEAGDPRGARAVADAAAGAALPACAPGGWWCDALAGFALHVDADFPAAERRFESALRAMPEDSARAWIDPEWLLPHEAAERWRELADDPAARDRFAVEWWRAADPFRSVPGNDLLTEHLSRRVVARTRREARTAYGMPWGDDLEELLLRYGWEIGWEITRPRASLVTAVPSAVGHQHPESRDFAPPAIALEDPGAAPAEAWNPGDREVPATGYAPAYAPRVVPAEVRIRVLPRGDSALVLAEVRMPEDTTYHAGHGHEPLPVPDRFEELGAWRALHLVPSTGREGEGAEDGAPRPPHPVDGLFDARTVPGERAPANGRLVLRTEVPAGDWTLHAEVVDPAEGRAGLHRVGLRIPEHAPDLPTISDLLIAGAAGAEPPESLDALLEGGFRDRFAPGDRMTIGWELYGFGFGEESLDYVVSIARDGGGVLRTAGRWLGLVDDPDPVELRWAEPSPERIGPAFRSVVATLPAEMEAGRWWVEVRVRTVGRTDLVLRTPIEVGPVR